MARASACAAAGASLLCAFIAGCTQVSTQSHSGSAPVHSWTRPGELRIADISDPSTLNPMLTGADVAYQLAGYTLEFLVQLDDRGEVVPILCTAVPSVQNGGVSKDGKTITYHLRRGVTWSDGAPFGSADIVASWRQVVNPLNNTHIREGYDVVARIDAPDRYTAVVRLKRPYAPFPTRFFSGIQEGPIGVLPAHIIARAKELNDSPLGAHPIGTGPFVLKSWERAGRMIFEANPHYWRGAPAIKRIIFQAQPSTSTELVGFKTHEIDADLDAGAQRMPEYATLAGMHAVRSRSLRLYLLDMNAGKAPLDDKRLRQAIAYAVDRREVLHNVDHDAGTIADEWVPDWSWGYTPNVPHYDYYPAKAAALLDSAGWRATQPQGMREKNGKPLLLNIVGITGSGSSKQTTTIVQSYLRAVGIDAQIKQYPYGIVFNTDGPIRGGKFDIAFYSFSVNYDPAALDDDGCDQFAPKGANDERYCDPVVDRLERQALALPDRLRRKPLYAQIQRRRMQSVAGLPLYFRDRVGVISDDLHGYTPSRGIVPQWNAWQWSVR
ncbi:MAG: peptide ABC transporter substrate-binding protein [Candidatus Eremiobacteraeota bacterium]|nr:peptide ABC transporter substrate-binding protein [Candidatus Eremiobacteraeota bacterium]